MIRTVFVAIGILISCYVSAQNKQAAIKDSISWLHETVKATAYTNPDEAAPFAERALQMSLANKFHFEEIQSYLRLGLVYYCKGYYVVSNDYYSKAVQPGIGTLEQRSTAWNNMGVNHEMLNQLDSALYAYNESMKIDRLLGDGRGEHMVLINLGILNSKLNHYDLAFEQTRKAQAYFSKTADIQNLATCYLNLGLFFNDLKQTDSLVSNYQTAEYLYSSINDHPNAMLCCLNLASFWSEQNNKTNAEHWFSKAFSLSNSVNSPLHTATMFDIGASIHARFGNRDSAYTYTKEAIKLYKDMGTGHHLKTTLFNLSHLYAEDGRIKEYKETVRIYDSISSELINQHMHDKLAEMEVRYKLEAKNDEIKAAKQSLSERNTQIFIILAFAFLILKSLIIVYYLYARIKRSNKILYQKNIELISKERAEKQTTVLPDVEDREENALLVRFKQLLIENQLYKNPDLTLKMAALELGTNEKYLSQAVNKSGSDNFNTFVNRFRVNEAQRIIVEDQDTTMTIEELAMQVGFSNRNTFSRAFIQITGISPSEYRKIHLSNGE